MIWGTRETQHHTKQGLAKITYTLEALEFLVLLVHAVKDVLLHGGLVGAREELVDLGDVGVRERT